MEIGSGRRVGRRNRRGRWLEAGEAVKEARAAMRSSHAVSPSKRRAVAT